MGGEVSMKRANPMKMFIPFLTAGITVSCSAYALQPLQSFLDAGKQFSYDNREAMTVLDQRHHEWTAALGRLLPSFNATGSYTRNEPQVEVEFPSFNAMGIPTGTNKVSIVQQNQLDLSLNLNIPLFHLPAILSMRAAQQTEEATRYRSQAIQNEVSQAIARAYYQYVASCALVTSAKTSLTAAEEQQKITQARLNQGAITDLELSRATVEVKRSEQSVADASFAMTTAARSLETLTNLYPDTGPCQMEAKPVILAEKNVSDWTQYVNQTPAVLAAQADWKSAQSNRNSTRAVFVPVIVGSVTDRLTNASGFSGQNNTVAAGISARWDFSGTSVANAQAAQAVVATTEIRLARTRRDVEDQIVNTHRQIETNKVQYKAAMEQVNATERAMQLAKIRYNQGAGTQLEWTQAQRDHFAATAARIQALANWQLSLTLLRLKTGHAISDT